MNDKKHQEGCELMLRPHGESTPCTCDHSPEEHRIDELEKTVKNLNTGIGELIDENQKLKIDRVNFKQWELANSKLKIAIEDFEAVKVYAEKLSCQNLLISVTKTLEKISS